MKKHRYEGPSLFDELEINAEPAGFDACLESYAFLWTATEKGNATGVRFMMTVKDAQTFCEDHRTSGVLHGTAWAFFWTTVRNYVEQYGEGLKRLGGQGYELKLPKFEDNGSRDSLIEELGCKKYDIKETRDILARFDIKLVCK